MSAPAKRAPTRCVYNNNNNNDNNISHINSVISNNTDNNNNNNSNNTRHAQRQQHSRLHPHRTRSPLFVLFAFISAIAIVALLPTACHAYNLDLPSYVRHHHERNSMFGFSIALHKARNGYTQYNSLVVGAPKFDTSAYQVGVREAGAVFRCVMEDDKCNLVKFDSLRDNRNTNGEIIDRKSYQWLGATVSTGRDNDLVVACAPRYVFHSMTPTKSLRYDPIGTCFTSRNFTQFNEVSPCRTNHWGYHRQGSCQAGFSAAINSNGSRLFIGAPGSWYWQGQSYSISPDATFPYKPPYYQPFGTGGQAYSHDVTRPENQVYSTAESSSHDDDSYLGYSMITGDFDNDRNEDVAIGMPRGAGLLGKIVVNSWNMANIFNITGHQIGEYFGYSLASSDIDGDGLDDLIIGAPMYTEPDNTEGKYDVGRVYILLQRGATDAEPWTTEYIREGYNSKGRFGLALTTLGDVNRDGFGDFAVGAPYDGPEGRGVVYIFHGSANGPLQKPSQIIKSEDLVEGAPYPRTFGFALSGGVDMDGNTYPDLAVGAYAADQVFIFKSRPVAAVNAETTFSNPSKLISLNQTDCVTARDNRRVACTKIATCWSYTGQNLPTNLEFDVSWVLDSRKTKNPRMFFLNDEGKNIRNQTIALNYGRKFCLSEDVYLTENIQDKLTPLEVEMRYNLRNNRQVAPVIRRRRDLQPVIDQNREIVLRDAINIQKNCGLDNICEPDLKLQIQTVDKYLMGSPEPLSIEVSITNTNEDAFEAAFYMVMPRNLDFNKLQPLGDKTDTPITCSVPLEANNYTLKCDIGNPLPGQKAVRFKVIMTPSEKFASSPSYDFYMEANSTNVEKPGSNRDNFLTKSIGVWVDTELTIEGISFPDFQLYKASDYKSVENATTEEDLGPQVVHIYNIRNNKSAKIEEALVLIHYPYETIAGDLLMYMTNQPETYGNIECENHMYANARNLRLDQNLLRKSYLKQIGADQRGTTDYADASASGAHIEKSDGSQGGVTTEVGRGTKVLSQKEKEMLEREDALDTPGDASDVHSARANQAAAAAASSSSSWSSGGATGGATSGNTGGGSGGSWSSSSTWSSSNGQPNVVVTAKNTTVYYDASGRPQVIETSTEYVQRAQEHSANYQQASVGGAASGGNAGRGMGAHSTRGHIQMASAQGGGGGGGDNSQQFAYTNSAGSSGGAYRQPVRSNVGGGGAGAQYNNIHVSAGNNDKSMYGGSGGGLRTSTVDLGTLHRGSVDNDLRPVGGSISVGGGSGGGGGGGSYTYRQSYTNGGGQTPTVTHQTSYSSNSKPYYGTENYYDEDNNNNNNQNQQQWSSSSSSSSGGNGGGSAHRRYRRANGAEEESLKQIDLQSPCQAARCQTLRCVVKDLVNDDGAWIAIRTRLVAKTMEKLASNVPLNVSTMAVANVTRLPFVGEPKDEIKKTHEIFYKAVPVPTPVPDVVPLWVVVLAACAGALILLLLIFLLYKCGFFNRNRPRDHSMERQPLRNGYHGDEHL